MLISTQHLDSNALDALDALVAACKKVDGNAIAIYRDLLTHYRSRPCSLLHYEGDQLIGFAAVFFFEHDVGEISLLVAPTHRKKGIAHGLLHTMLGLIEADRPIETLVFSTPQGLYDAELLHRGLQHQGSEYEMQRESHEPLALNIHTLSILEATPADIDTLCAIDRNCFPTSQPSSETRFGNLLIRPDHTIFLAIHEQAVIGKAHLARHAQDAHLSDVAILPALQRQGFGRALITHCINHALTWPQTKVTLGVETSNQHALQLYLDLNFTISNAIDYWGCPFADQRSKMVYT